MTCPLSAIAPQAVGSRMSNRPHATPAALLDAGPSAVPPVALPALLPIARLPDCPMVDHLGMALVSIGMLLAFGGGTLGFEMIRVATALERDKT